MNRKLKMGFAIALMTFGAGLFVSHDSFAKQKDPLDLIQKVSSMKAPNCGNHDNPYKATLFDVKFKWGTGCNKQICKVISNTFHCIDPGDYCTTADEVRNGSLSVSSVTCPSGVSTKKWDCYKVVIPAEGDYQNVEGRIKRLKEFDLVAYAKLLNLDGSISPMNGGSAISSSTAFYGSNASVTSAYYNPAGYTWLKWGAQGACSGAGANRGCSVNMTADHNVNAYYVRNIWQGVSSLWGDASTSTGWVNTNSTKIAHISNCSPVNGCHVNFNHKIRRISGSGSTPYTVSRSSNLVTSTKAIANDGGVRSGNSNSNGVEEEVSRSGAFTLYPGMVLCEKLTFAAYNTPNAGTVATQVCVSAEGNAQPTDPGNPDTIEDPTKNSGDTSFVNIRVRNATVNKWGQFRREVYAKPSDKVVFRATYNPVLQYAYYIRPQQMVINSGGTVYPSGTAINTSSMLGEYFNAKKPSGLYNWNNAYSVFSRNFASGMAMFNYAKAFAPGNSAKQQELIPDPKRSNGYVVAAGDVGKSLEEVIKTNYGTNINNYGTSLGISGGDRTTPSQVSFTNTGDKNRANVITNSRDRTSYVRVPYNFTTDSEVTTNETTIFFAGEDAKIDYRVDVLPRNNPETTNNSSERYATKVDEAAIKLIVYYPGAQAVSSAGTASWPNMNSSKGENLCSYYGLPNNQVTCGVKNIYDSTTLNGGGNPNGEQGQTKQVSFSAQDLSAGSKVCVAVANYPSTSGEYKNYNDKQGDHRWRISQSKCYTIAKRPSIQIWGGNLFTRGAVVTGMSIKNNVAGVTNYNVNTKNDMNYIFGSWGELGLISGGSVKGFASAAGTGYASNSNGNLVPNPFGMNNVGNTPGGGREKSPALCNRSRLTFANTTFGLLCSGNGPVGAIGNSSGKAAGEKDLAMVTERFSNPGPENVSGGSVSVNDGTPYFYSTKDLVLDASSVTRGIHVVQSDKNITIAGNITYSNDRIYKSFDSKEESKLAVPKIVIYAKGDITISCGDAAGNNAVTRIDALLVSEGKVRTCDSTNINSRRNSTQLVINGSVVAKKLIPNRTYGAATGMNSIVSAEIINYDPTLYLWGSDGDDDSDGDGDGGGDSSGFSGGLDITYTREIPARR